MMTRYNARTTNPSKFLEPKFNTNPDYQNKISKQIIKLIIKTNYQNKIINSNYQNKIIKTRLSKQDYQN